MQLTKNELLSLSLTCLLLRRLRCRRIAATYQHSAARPLRPQPMPPLLLRFPPVNYLTGATRSIDWPTNQPLDPAAIGAIADKHLRKTIRPTDLSQLFFRDAVDSKMVRHLTNWLPLCPLVETLTNNKNCHKNLWAARNWPTGGSGFPGQAGRFIIHSSTYRHHQQTHPPALASWPYLGEIEQTFE